MRRSIIDQVFLDDRDIERLKRKGLSIALANGNRLELVGEFKNGDQSRSQTITDGVIGVISELPGQTASQIARKLKANYFAVNSALARLLLKKAISKKKKLYFPHANGKQ